MDGVSIQFVRASYYLQIGDEIGQTKLFVMNET